MRPCLDLHDMTRNVFSLATPLLIAMLLLVGCASTPPPRTALNSAETAIDEARRLGAPDYAPVELGRAVRRLAAAGVAFSERDYAAAERYAVQADLEAQLAQYRSRAAAGREAVRQRTDENARLRVELLGEGGLQ